ncbi:MAG TPA: spore germination protein [Firmicutes bacterium]|mgnify:FL=1|jgi:hypothetical protein|nr:spore germination protein [Bacillota bacterium]HBL49091.1 spore germination protein [Bacillota bacterium]HBL68014.1 spore germination protein [Bacillota bacterium]HCF90337.1 spore germination protein [Bacillota bacterium]
MAEGRESNLSKDLRYNEAGIDTIVKDCPGIARHRLRLQKRDAVLFFMEALVSKDFIQRDVLGYLLSQDGPVLRDLERYNNVPIGTINKLDHMDQVIDAIMDGQAVLIADGVNQAFSFKVNKKPQRSIEEPATEKDIRGPHNGFIERLEANTALIQSYLKTPALKMRRYETGLRSKTTVGVFYIEGLANPKIIDEFDAKIKAVKTDSAFSPSYLEELIGGHAWTTFPLFYSTERVDKAVAYLLEGRLVILVDGFPQSLSVPSAFVMALQTADDYNIRAIAASVIRLLRFGALFISLFLPALYIAILTFHYETIPLSLLIPLAETRSKVPFPPVVEAFTMELIFEVIRESGIRLPSPIGQTVGVVGGLVLGQAAVAAGIVSNVMIIVVALTGMANFIIPNFEVALAIRLVRFPLMILAAMFGIVGISVGSTILFTHLISLKSLGQPYMIPFFPFNLRDLKDAFIIMPAAIRRSRPTLAQPQQYRRKKN